MISKAKVEGRFSGFKVAVECVLTHLFFVDIFLLGSGKPEECHYMKGLLDGFCKASGLSINEKKCYFFHVNTS